MSWEQIGSVVMGYDWRFLNSPVTNTSLFRFRHEYIERPLNGGGQVVQGYGVLDTDFYGLKSFYPNSSFPLILTLDIPPQFVVNGINTRYLLFRLSPRAKVFNFNWRVFVDGWINEV